MVPAEALYVFSVFARLTALEGTGLVSTPDVEACRRLLVDDIAGEVEAIGLSALLVLRSPSSACRISLRRSS